MNDLIQTLTGLTNLERVLLPVVGVMAAVIVALFRRLEKATEARLLDRQILADMAKVLTGVERMVELTYELLKEGGR